MFPTLMNGDIIIASKMCYGPRVVKFYKLLKEKKLEFNWYQGFRNPQKGDVFVFNLPKYFSLIESHPDFYGDFIVKRCYAAFNDTVLIQNEIKKNNEALMGINNENKPLLFPFDSAFNWTIYHYGPLWVPGKGKTMKMTYFAANHYKSMLLYEGNTIDIRSDSVFLNREYAHEYTFKENYYFMVGDNFDYSIDSRYWGFVPEKSIVGKAVLVLFSLDPDKPWYNKFRWNRFMKKV
jgi:signal peptidase I